MARILRGEELARFLSGLIHAPKQVGPLSVDLTLHALFRPSRQGSLDFGGGEYAPAVRDALPARKRRPEENYGWWEAEGGVYLMEYNESLSLPAGFLSVLHPHERILEAGAFHPTLVLV
ncbi:MAG: deoxycytidine triphosphate deaminase, partial [Nitrospinota bacterium]